MKKINPETWRNYKFAGEEDGKNCTIYYLSDSDGSGKGIMHVYEVMNGILMSYDVLDMKSCWQNTPPVPGFIQRYKWLTVCIFTYSLRKIQRHFYYD